MGKTSRDSILPLEKALVSQMFKSEKASLPLSFKAKVLLSPGTLLGTPMRQLLFPHCSEVTSIVHGLFYSCE